MVDNQIQSLVQTTISIANAPLKKVHSEIQEEVRGVALQWSQISISMTKWDILPDPQEIVWKGRCWNFIPIEIQSADGCICQRPTNGAGLNRCTCLW